jgi:DNA repair photolyase
VLLRLPYEVKDLFKEWLATHAPLKASHVMARIHELRGGRDNDPRFGSRHTGEGIYAELLEKRFDVACRKYGRNGDERFELDTSTFVAPRPDHPQRSLW